MKTFRLHGDIPAVALLEHDDLVEWENNPKASKYVPIDLSFKATPQVANSIRLALARAYDGHRFLEEISD